MKFAIGCDHAAFDEKSSIIKFLEEKGIECKDVGTNSKERCDYPDFATAVCKEVNANSDVYGILLCGTGIGVSMTANRYKGMRAGVCKSVLDAEMTRAHNDANIICVGVRTSTMEAIQAMIETFIKTPFEEGRHVGRIAKFNDLGETLN
jgi:ribose 5-phosphate isomerase B